MKYPDLHCSCCKKWDKGVRRYEIEGATQRLCPECFKRICDIKLKQSLEKAGNKPTKSKQIALFSEEDLAKKNPEPEQPAMSTPISGHYVGLGLGENPAIDCIHYIAAGTCIARGDAFGCEECEDYKSINGDEPDDD